MEEWKDIPEYIDYRISNRGRVWSTLSRKYLKQHRYGTKRIEEKQHLRVRLYFEGCEGKPKKYPVHQIVMLCFGIPCPEGMDMIDHIDGNPHNNHIDNLRWYTNTLNQKNQIATLMRGNTPVIGVSRVETYKRYNAGIRHNGHRYFKYFHDATHGGKDGALESAKEWRRQKEIEFGYIVRE